MSQLSIAILGLNRIGTSIGLALRRYMQDGGKHKFTIVGYDPIADNEKQALKAGAVDRTERRPGAAVTDCDLVVMNLAYDLVRDTYKDIRRDLRDGVVILDCSPVKRPSLQWATDILDSEKHLVGMTPIVNPRYLFDSSQNNTAAAADYFDNSAIVLTPAPACVKEAVDLAFNFCSLLGSRPRFLDPAEHDMFLAQTEGVSNVLGVALFYQLMQQPGWHDMQWFTNAAFGGLTRPLFDIHPDALRDEWLANRDVLARTLESLLTTLQNFRALLAENDKAALEAALSRAAEEYETWINHRHHDDWDEAMKPPKLEVNNTMLGTLLGGKLVNRLTGKKDD